jgi:hypothetical protein
MTLQLPLVEIAVDPQMPDDIEIGYSPLRMLRLVGMGAVMTLLRFLRDQP